MKIENTGFGDAKRIMDRDVLIGMAIKYSNGLWAPHAADDDKKLAAAVFKTPVKVRKWFEEKANG